MNVLSLLLVLEWCEYKNSIDYKIVFFFGWQFFRHIKNNQLVS